MCLTQLIAHIIVGKGFIVFDLLNVASFLSSYYNEKVENSKFKTSFCFNSLIPIYFRHILLKYNNIQQGIMTAFFLTFFFKELLLYVRDKLLVSH